MCGRYDLSASPRDLARHFKLASEPSLLPRYNIAPTQDVPVVYESKTKGRIAAPMKWGLIPFWAKDASIGNRMINARAESVATTPAFRNLIESRRCLVPATGFYEWLKTGKTSQPYRIHLRDNGLLAFAGLWDTWRDAEGNTVRSFTILTGQANELVEPIHDRMPVVIAPDQYETWLTGELDESRLAELAGPFPAGQMEAYAVSKHVSKPDNDDPLCVEPLPGEPAAPKPPETLF
ncbi:MAG: SOS response-associated peptidase [Phycisphaerales bacterium]|nr:SOS response-associated peptidase [Phycisphaerales bacterium]